jgi:hypothetical protein
MSGNPAAETFAAEIDSELLLAQVLILRLVRGFELRHVSDRSLPAAELRLVPIPELRPLAQFTSAGAFRPLKSAPNLERGWRTTVATSNELGLALQHLYPNAIADWFAARQTPPSVTNYRDFTNRQTGMYRVTQLLTDSEAGTMIRACCDPKVCLKRRLWSVQGLEIDAPEPKSLIPCLEPCALLLEFARTVARLQQSGKANGDEKLPEHSGATVREADFSVASNPRRQLLELANRDMIGT